MTSVENIPVRAAGGGRSVESMGRQAQTPYADALRGYAAQDWLRLNVPGHTASAKAAPELVATLGDGVLELDIPPLVDGIDKGAWPTPLDRAEGLAAEAWGARRTWFLTNGASKGNLVAALTLRQLGRQLVVQRSVHSSVVDGLALSGLLAHFVQPELDPELGVAHGLTPAALAEGLRANPDAVGAYVVSPSYFGAVSDIAALASTAHSFGVPLVVDEAWGSHFGFHPDLPTGALALGADLVISSTHKLAGSLTQSAMLHLAEGPFADAMEPLVHRAFRSLQSTSASSLLLLSLDVARRRLAVDGAVTIARTLAMAARMHELVRAGARFGNVDERFLASPGVLALDPLRVVVNTRVGGISGHEARQLLFDDHRIHLEMSTDALLVAVLGAGSLPDADRFVHALHTLPDHPAGSAARIDLPETGPAALSVREAYFSPAEIVSAHEAVGRVSSDSLAAYPPGIPNVLPGEVLTASTIDFLRRTAASPAGHVRGAVDRELSCFRVLRSG